MTLSCYLGNSGSVALKKGPGGGKKENLSFKFGTEALALKEKKKKSFLASTMERESLQN